MSFLSVSGSSDSRSASEALTISDLSVMMAALRAFTAVSRAILAACRHIPFAYSTAVDRPLGWFAANRLVLIDQA